MSELIYYKKNCHFDIGVRSDLLDRKGQVLTVVNPYYAVRQENIRDFKIANRESLEKGYIMETTEPSVDWDTSNAISDEKAAELVKTYIGLKNELPKLTSLAIVKKLLAAAEEQDRPTKTIRLIEARINELDDQEISLEDMRGVQ